MSVIKHDFGIDKRHTARRLTRLISLDALHEANVRNNPVPYLERASHRIDQLEEILFEAVQAARPPAAPPASTQTVEVDQTEYQRLLACRSIVENGLAWLTAERDKP